MTIKIINHKCVTYKKKTYRKLLEDNKNQLAELAFWTNIIATILSVGLLFTNQATVSPIFFVFIY